MTWLEIKANVAVDGRCDPATEADKLEEALRAFFNAYNAQAGDVSGYQVAVKGESLNQGDQ